MFGRLIVAIALAVSSAWAADIPRQYRIETIAGADIRKHDDGGRAKLSYLWGPSAIALGPHGEIYFSESTEHMVRVIDANGVIRTIAGTGEPGSDVDGRLGVETRLRSPEGVAVDSQGTVYVADTSNNIIRKIAADGTSSALHFREWRGSSRGIGADGVPDRLNWPSYVSVDAQRSVFIADTYNHVIRKIDREGKAIVLAGTGKEGFIGDEGSAVKAQLAYPTGIAVDPKGTVYIADSRNGRIRAIDSSGKIRTVAGGGAYDGDGRPATGTRFFEVIRVATDEQGTLYALEHDDKTDQSRVRKIERNGIVCTLLGEAGQVSSCPASIQFDGKPSDIAVDKSGAIYFSDSRYEQIFRIEGSRKLTAIAGIGPGDGISAKLAHSTDLHESLDPLLIGGPHIEVDRAGNIYISDGPRIRMIDTEGIVRTMAGSNARNVGHEGDGGPAGSALLGDPKGMAFDAAGTLFFADGDRVRKIQGGVISLVGQAKESSAGGDASAKVSPYLHGLALTADGSVLASDINNNRIVKIEMQGQLQLVAGNGWPGFEGDSKSASNALLNSPTDVAVDASGAIYICDSGNHTIRRIGPDGIISSLTVPRVGGFYGDGGPAAEARLKSPKGIAVGRDGALYIADTGNHRVRMIWQGNIYTIAGKTSRGFDGDGGPATEAHLDTPSDVAVDEAGNVYVCDYGNGRIRKLTPIK